MTFRRCLLRLTDPAPPSSPKRLVSSGPKASRWRYAGGAASFSGRPSARKACPRYSPRWFDAVSLNGNTPTLRTAGRSKRLQSRVSLRRRARAAPPRIVAQPHRKAGLAIVHTLATHNQLLGYRLAAGGIDPDRDVVPTVMPPAETAAALREVRIGGCCAGAPSGDVAARAGFGRTVATLHTIWNHCPEKVFAVREEIAAARPGSCTRFCARC